MAFGELMPHSLSGRCWNTNARDEQGIAEQMARVGGGSFTPFALHALCFFRYACFARNQIPHSFPFMRMYAGNVTRSTLSTTRLRQSTRTGNI